MRLKRQKIYHSGRSVNMVGPRIQKKVPPYYHAFFSFFNSLSIFRRVITHYSFFYYLFHFPPLGIINVLHFLCHVIILYLFVTSSLISIKQKWMWLIWNLRHLMTMKNCFWCHPPKEEEVEVVCGWRNRSLSLPRELEQDLLIATLGRNHFHKVRVTEGYKILVIYRCSTSKYRSN